MVIVTAIMVIMMVMIIMAAIVIAIASVFVMSRAGSPFDFFDIGVSIHYLYQLADCHRTDQFIRAQVQNTITETIKFSHLSPYKLGSQLKP